MNAQRTFLLDINAVKAYGVARWQSEFSWPVSDQEFIVLANAIERRMREIIARVGGDIGLAFLIARRLPIAIEYRFHARAVVDRIQAAGATPICSPGAQWYAELLGTQFDTQAIRLPPTFTATTRLNWLRPAVRAVRWGREVAANAVIPKMIARCRSGKGVFLYGSPYPFLAEQLGRSVEWISTLYADELTPASTLPRTIHDDISAVSAAFVADCLQDAAQCGFPSDASDVKALRDITITSLTNAAQALQCMRAYVAEHSIAHGYLSVASNEMQRAFAVAVHGPGGHVTSMAHGGFVGLFNTPTLSYSEFALSDTYVTYTDGSAELCARIQRSHPSFVPNVCGIVSGASAIYQNMRNVMCSRPPHNVRTVMVIGYPQNVHRKPASVATLGLQQLDFELRIIDALRAEGYEVIYKVHPDRISEVCGIFDGRAKVITEDFQTAHAYADAYVFGTMRTSAFAIALCTQKPIVAVLMDEEPSTPFSDALALLERRVAVIRARLDDHARVWFDPTTLTDALADPPNPRDTAFFDTYLASSSSRWGAPN